MSYGVKKLANGPFFGPASVCDITVYPDGLHMTPDRACD